MDDGGVEKQITIEAVGVVGGGQMGAGIAEVCAKAGLDVVLVEVSAEVAARALDRIRSSLAKAVERGKLGSGDAEAAIARIRPATDLEALADRDLVIEAVVEDESAKRDLFARLDTTVSPHGILATNTSSIPVTRLAAATARRDRVLGVHFFNPAPIMPLVEIVTTLDTSEAVAAAVADFVANRLGKTVVQVGDRAGFVVNALLIPYLLEAIRMVEAGYASPTDVDAAMKAGAGHPMGPLELCDLIGNDVVLAVAESLHAEFAEPRLAPPPLLRRMVEAGRLGRKAGRGFVT